MPTKRLTAQPSEHRKNRATGVREVNKNERLSRIKRAARDLFLQKGYDKTTLRMIGEQAGVGAGTIFRNVTDKRDLLYLLFNGDHRRVTEEALDAISESAAFLDQCVNGFRFYYRYFGRNPEFARAVLREATFYVPRPGNHAHEASTRSIDRIKRIVAVARKRGEITSRADDHAIAVLIFELYQMECRRWLASPKPDVRNGLQSLRRTLELLLQGLQPDRH